MTHEDTSQPQDEPVDAATSAEPPVASESAEADTVEVKSAEAETAEVETAEADVDDAAADDAAEDDPAAPKRSLRFWSRWSSGTEEADTDDASARSPIASLALAAAVAALIAAVVCLGYFGYTGIRAYTVDSEADQLRNESVDAAEQAVLNITAVDPKDTAGWKKRLESSLTGDALKQVNTGVVADVEQRVAASGGQVGKLESRITRSATTELSTDDDTATVLVFANVASTIPNQPVAQQQMGFLLTMVDVDGVRKATKVVALNPIDYTDTGSGVSTAPGQGTADQSQDSQPQEGGN